MANSTTLHYGREETVVLYDKVLSILSARIPAKKSTRIWRQLAAIPFPTPTPEDYIFRLRAEGLMRRTIRSNL